jgi:hypothetical protein
VAVNPETEASLRFKARLAGIFYLLNILTGASALFARGTLGSAVLLISTACYVAVTLLFYQLFRPVDRTVSALAAFCSLVGCTLTTLDTLHLVAAPVSPLVFFGLYCLLIGYLILRSTFLPRLLGVLMAIGGLGWLTYFSPTLSSRLAPYNMAPGILGEASLTLWLLVVGINAKQWLEQPSLNRAA